MHKPTGKPAGANPPRESKPLVVAQNRKARYDYHIHDTYEAGIVLSGTEVKSLREGRANLTDAYGTVDEGEVWLRGRGTGGGARGFSKLSCSLRGKRGLWGGLRGWTVP